MIEENLSEKHADSIESVRQVNKYGLCIIMLVCAIADCDGQTKKDNQTQYRTDKTVGGGCEGCELMYVGMPKVITAEHTTPGWTEGKQKLIITGKVLQSDGKTPAANVIVYYWHTDDQGLYTSDSKVPARAREHGRLRGWVKSDSQGNYKIKTSRPAAYPDQDIPQHIHLSIKEPDIANAYYADLYFQDDPLYAIHKKKYGQINRAGTEVLNVTKEEDVMIARHNIILGLNIPDYPSRRKP
jgi:protocatechuate 3,4-dioxygenase beta subunit